MPEKGRSWFDRFADRSERVVSSAAFFAFCALVVVLWAPTILLPGMKIDTWQLIVNTLTTIITFLLVALLTNTQARFENRTDANTQATTEKLDRVLALLEGGRHAPVAETSEGAGPA